MELTELTLLLSITLQRKYRSCSRGICCLVGFGCFCSHRALTLHCLADISSLFSTFHHQWLILKQATQVRSYSIYRWLNCRYAWEGGNWKKLQQKCPLEHPCTGENTIKSPLLWQPMECPLGWSLSGGNVMWGHVWAALHLGIFDGIRALCSSLDISRLLQILYCFTYQARIDALAPGSRFGSLFWFTCSRTHEQGLTCSDLLITSFTTSATAAHHSHVDKNHTWQSQK